MECKALWLEGPRHPSETRSPTQAFHSTDSNFRAESVDRARCWTKPVPWDRKAGGAPSWAPPGAPFPKGSYNVLMPRRGFPRFFDPKRWVTNPWQSLEPSDQRIHSWVESVRRG